MLKKLFLSALVSILLFPSFTPAHPASTTRTPQTEWVYICNGPRSVVYHRSPDCRGLSRCSTKIEKVTLEYAQKIGRRPCKIEY